MFVNEPTQEGCPRQCARMNSAWSDLRVFFPVQRRAVEEQSEMVQDIASDDTDVRVGQQVSPPESPPQEREAGEHGLRLADRAVEPDELIPLPGPFEPERRGGRPGQQRRVGA